MPNLLKQNQTDSPTNQIMQLQSFDLLIDLRAHANKLKYIVFLIFPKCISMKHLLTRLLSLKDLLHCDFHNGFHSHPFIAIVQSDKKRASSL